VEGMFDRSKSFFDYDGRLRLGGVATSATSWRLLHFEKDERAALAQTASMSQRPTLSFLVVTACNKPIVLLAPIFRGERARRVCSVFQVPDENG